MMTKMNLVVGVVAMIAVARAVVVVAAAAATTVVVVMVATKVELW